MTVIVPLSLSAETNEEERPRLPLAIEVFLKKPAQHQYDLHIHLTNISDTPVMVDVRDLPWNPMDGDTWFSAFRLDAQKPSLQHDAPLGRFGSRQVRLMPGESIQNSMPLNARMPSLLQDIAQFGVQLRWDCPPPNLLFFCKQGSPTTITIPKGDLGQPDIYTIDTDACLAFEHRIGLLGIPEGQEVLFLLTPEPVITALEKVQALLLEVDEYVTHCQPQWTNSWAVSFFTDPQFAGFLRDGDNPRYFKEGLWQRANVGQYSSQIRTLFRFPWIKKRADTHYLSVYHLRQNHALVTP
ncbi:MAG: hypothetical protein GKS05_03350 [Nitrospirales bacterium]|nr:hypothetical protein [Nitrospirales bacterium]